MTMTTGTYHGPIDRLVDERALLRDSCDEPHGNPSSSTGYLLAQFNNTELVEAYGWHRFPTTDFEVDPEKAPRDP